MKSHKPKAETYIHINATTSKALTTLKGIIEGVLCDNELNDLEHSKILEWIDAYSFLKGHAVMGKVFDYLAEALADGILTKEEAQDITWMIERNLNSYYDSTTQQIQILQGILAGIAADNVIKDVELKYLLNWLNENEKLKGVFPYDEIYTLVCDTVAKKILSKEEKAFLLRVFDFTDNNFLTKDNPFMPWATDPQIEISDRTFCISGASKRAKRGEFVKVIRDNNGTFTNSVSKKIDYLIVCAEPNVAWTHACYGRKIEQAIHLRKNGARLLVVCENDFWDSIVE